MYIAIKTFPLAKIARSKFSSKKPRDLRNLERVRY